MKWVVEYPPGQSPYGPDNIILNNSEIAKIICSELNGCSNIPISIRYLLLDLNSMNNGWFIKSI